MRNDDVESTLNELVETSKDGEKGFRKASQDARNPELKSLFDTCAARCAQGARELQDAIRASGGDPESGGSVAGALHRGWISVKEAVASRDDKAILEECERGEDYAKAQYKKALEHELPAEVSALVQRQYQGVIANHDKVRSLRDSYRAKA
ncbi:MAG TPA: PA2169 family four-helix-bundle protein [Casimicrobiaceae bacterium]|nr:PA2169 family four-helix-bundle protein [Casimicrobiaceae bacterium]